MYRKWGSMCRHSPFYFFINYIFPDFSYDVLHLQTLRDPFYNIFLFYLQIATKKYELVKVHLLLFFEDLFPDFNTEGLCSDTWGSIWGNYSLMFGYDYDGKFELIKIISTVNILQIYFSTVMVSVHVSSNSWGSICYTFYFNVGQ